MLNEITGHYIVCGAGRVGRSVVDELQRSEAAVVLIDNNPDRAKWASDQDILTLVADATKDETLKQARLDRDKDLVAVIASDAQKV